MKFVLKKILMGTLGGFLLITLILFILSLFVVVENIEMRGVNNPSFTCINTTKHQNIYKEIKIIDIVEASLLTDIDESCGYDTAVFEWTNDKSNELTFEVNIENSGNYQIGIDYQSLNSTIIDSAISIYINDELQTNLAENMRLMTSWTNETDEMVFDSKNNQVLNRQVSVQRWDYELLREHIMLNSNAIEFSFVEGINTIKIIKEEGEFLLGNLFLVNNSHPITYVEYLNNHRNQVLTTGNLMTLEAENSAYKNDVSIIYQSEKSPNVSPYKSDKNYVNIVGNYFYKPGQKITYAFDVEEEGYYNITLKYKNDIYQNINVYRNIYVNDELIFNELASYEFSYSSNWVNETLGKQTNYQFYFNKGINTVSIEVDGSNVSSSYVKINEIIDEIGDLSLKIKKLIGGTKDTKREWDLDKYLPEAKIKLDEWHAEMDTIISDLEMINSNPKKSNEIEKKLYTVQLKLTELKNNHNKLPGKMNLLSEGSSSISQSLALISQKLIDLPLSIDKIYIHSVDVKLPKANANLFERIIASFQRIISVAKPEETDEETLEIWVNRSRFYVDLMQQMADSRFTPESGIKVKFSIMPDEQKLIMANAANTQPDVALGVSGWLPYELGIRGAATDLRQFPEFNTLLNNFLPSSILHMIHHDKVYGLPETQDFSVTFYRKDIFDYLGLDVPQTYDEIIEILPNLQRYGMNYYLPLSSGTGLKAITATAPFIYQYGADLYTEDAFSAAIDTEESIKAISMMIELYTLYSLPLQTPNFYDSFRSGRIPIGVANFDMYNKLLFAAPEIANKWDIALAPGVLQDDNTIKRDYMGTAQSVVIFEKSDKKVEGFEFIQWWLSTETQKQFIYDLQLIYGEGFLWHSANIEAFRTLPLRSEHIEIIEAQWEYLHEVPKIPGYYIIERELSNAWNRVVFDSESIRIAVDDAVVIMNREIERKMKEFGYLDKDGNKLKPYILPTKEKVIEWQEEAKK